MSGVFAGWRHGRWFDHGFRLTAFVATSIPPFIMGFVFIAVFYVGLRWFPLGRFSPAVSIAVNASNFHHYTGLVTLDGFLNRRPDISLDAFHHLVMPVITLSLLHWATLSRITRAMMVEELDKDYVIAARARGLTNRLILWRHTFRNVLSPALASMALSTASLITGVYVVEVIFGLHGVSELFIRSIQFSNSGQFNLDAPAAMGFAVYSVLIVLILLLVFDVMQIAVDPWARKGVGET
jgi:peptide/nickel transport system permease protein